MCKRSKRDVRRRFSYVEKQEILSKSKGRCSHCGKKISIGDTFTIEHIIPLAQGGTNDMSNLIGLCNDCNRDKADKVVVPSLYFRFLNKNLLHKLDVNFDEYCKEMSFVSAKNMFFSDQVEYSIPFKKTPRSVSTACFKFKMSKCYYSDLDDVYNFCLNYFKFIGVNLDVKKMLSTYFDKSCIYYTRLRNGNIDFVLLPSVESERVDDTKLEYGINFLVLADPSLDLRTEYDGRACVSSMSPAKLEALLDGVAGSFDYSKSTNGLDEDDGIVTISWYSSDKRIGEWIKEAYLAYLGMSEEEREQFVGIMTYGMSNICFCDHASDEWNTFLSGIYNWVDEMDIFRRRVDEKHTGIIDSMCSNYIAFLEKNAMF